jgi:hypothetical protein
MRRAAGSSYCVGSEISSPLTTQGSGRLFEQLRAFKRGNQMVRNLLVPDMVLEVYYPSHAEK